MAEWIYFIHPPRDDFAETMTEQEQAVWAVHFDRFKRLLAEGTMILVGPTGGRTNTGIAVFEAPDEASAQDHGGGPGDRRRLRPRRAAAVPGLPAARARLTRRTSVRW
jgi:hypothetical protein